MPQNKQILSSPIRQRGSGGARETVGNAWMRRQSCEAPRRVPEIAEDGDGGLEIRVMHQTTLWAVNMLQNIRNAGSEV